MSFAAGTVDVGETPVPVCTAGPAGVRIRNRGGTLVYLGGPDVGYEGPGQGYPLDPGEAERFYGATPKESPVVPAPPGDLDLDVVYARTAPGTGVARVTWISGGG